MPIISVVIPLYNKGRYIDRCLRAVLAQTACTPFEVIVVDDGSTDDGPDRVRTYSDTRVQLLQQANSGASGARNTGILRSRGDWVAFLDADDEWMPWHMEAVCEAIQAFPEADIVYTGWVLDRDSTGTGLRGPKAPPFKVTDYFRHIEKAQCMWTSGIVVRREPLVASGMFRSQFEPGEDTDLWRRLCWSGHQVVHVPQVSVIYHQAASEAVARGRQAGSKHLPRLRAEYRWQLTKGLVLPALRPSVKRAMDRAALSEALDAALSGRRVDALRCLIWDYRGSWLPSRLAKAIAALLMPSDAYLMLGKVWRRASGGQIACPQQR